MTRRHVSTCFLMGLLLVLGAAAGLLAAIRRFPPAGALGSPD